MKKILTLITFASLIAHPILAATIADWTFETSAFTSVTNVGVSPASTSIVPEIGSGTATGVHASASTAWTSPTGDGSTKSLSSDHWGVGDFYQFTVNLDQLDNSYSAFTVSYNQNGSGTGPKTFSFQYSVDGGAYTSFGSDYSIAAVTWTAGATIGNNESFDLSSIVGLNSASTLSFRVVDDSTVSINNGTVGTGGTDRIDDFTIGATITPVPEPSTMALIGVGIVSFLGWKRVRRKV